MINTLDKDLVTILTYDDYEWASPTAQATYLERAALHFTTSEKKYFDIIVARFGLGNFPPQTFKQLATSLGRYADPTTPSNAGSIRNRYENAMERHRGFLLKHCKDLIVKKYHTTRAERISEGLRCSRKINS